MCCLFGMIDLQHRVSDTEKSRILSVLATACEARINLSAAPAAGSRWDLEWGGRAGSVLTSSASAKPLSSHLPLAGL